MGLSSLVAAMEARLPAILADTEELVKCESPSADLEAVARSADLVADVGARNDGRRLGRPIRRHDTGPQQMARIGSHGQHFPFFAIQHVGVEARLLVPKGFIKFPE